MLGLEEDEISTKTNKDLDLLAEIDFMQADDEALIVALEGLGYKLSGEGVVSYIYKILEHREAKVKQSVSHPRFDLRHLSRSLWNSICMIITDTLKREPLPERALHSKDNWDWIKDAVLILLSASPEPLMPVTEQIVENYLSTASAEFIDALLDSLGEDTDWFYEQGIDFLIKVTKYLLPEEGRSMLPFSLRGSKCSTRAWDLVTEYLRRSIEVPSLVARLQVEHKIFICRWVFGTVHYPISPEFQALVYTSFRSDMVEQLMVPIRPSRVLSHGPETALYILHLLTYHRGPSTTLEFSNLPEHSADIVYDLLNAAIEVEVRQLKASPDAIPGRGIQWDESICLAINSILAMSQHSYKREVLDTVLDALSFDCIGILESATSIDDAHHTYANIIPLLLRVLGQSGTPIEAWRSELTICDDPKVVDMVTKIATDSLFFALSLWCEGSPKNPSAYNEMYWIEFAVQIVLTCATGAPNVHSPTEFRIMDLMKLHGRTILGILPESQPRRDHALFRFWMCIDSIYYPDRVEILQGLWPGVYSHSVAGALLEVIKQDADAFRDQGSIVNGLKIPRGSATRTTIRNFIEAHLKPFLHHSLRGRDACAAVDNLQILVDSLPSHHSWWSFKCIVRCHIRIPGLRWSEWMKAFVKRELHDSDPNRSGLAACFCYNAAEILDMISVRSKLWMPLLEMRLDISTRYALMDSRHIFEAFVKHPEPSRSGAEYILMRMLHIPNSSRPISEFSVSQFFDNGDWPPAYACISLALRMIKCYTYTSLLKKGRQSFLPLSTPATFATTSNSSLTHVTAPLLLDLLPLGVWEDVTITAAYVLELHRPNDSLNEFYFGGLEAYDMARRNAVMILISPYSGRKFPDDLCYKVLCVESSLFWRYEEVEESVRSEMELHWLERMREWELKKANASQDGQAEQNIDHDTRAEAAEEHTWTEHTTFHDEVSRLDTEKETVQSDESVFEEWPYDPDVFTRVVEGKRRDSTPKEASIVSQGTEEVEKIRLRLVGGHTTVYTIPTIAPSIPDAFIQV